MGFNSGFKGLNHFKFNYRQELMSRRKGQIQTRNKQTNKQTK